MLTLTWPCLFVLAVVVRHAAATPSYYSTQDFGNASMPFSRLMPRQDDSFDETDLSGFISNLAAIGDSYSAGIGAGDRLGNIGQIQDKQSGMLAPFATYLGTES